MIDNLFAIDGKFSQFMNFLWNVILLSVLLLACSIPVVTIGPACCAAYYAASKSIRRHNGTLAREFFRAFRENLRQGILFGLGYLVVLIFLLLDCAYFYGNENAGSLELLYLFYGLIVVVIAHMHYAFPILSRFSQPIFQHFRMATILTFRHILSSILLLLLFAATVVGVYFMPWGILVFPGLCVYAQTFPMEKILRGCMPPPTPEEEDKWYYQ